jgi:hypothetical protein
MSKILQKKENTMTSYIVENPEALTNTNKIISDLFDTKESFSVVRIGNMEGYFLDCYDKGDKPLDEFYHWLSLTSGVFPHNDEYLKNIWAPINHEAMINADVLGFVDISGHLKANESFTEKYCKNKPVFYGVSEILALDPGYLVNMNIVNVPCENPWTEKLKGKRVLVVSSFVESIKYQWDYRKEIWEDKLEKILPFELVDVVRSPFHPQMDSRNLLGCNSWDQVSIELKRQIDSYDYDVLLVSAAALAPTLADHAKSKGKIGITICGTLQLFFGIIGARWAGKNPSYTAWPTMFNEYWRWPSEADLPDNKQLFDRFEHAYWK